jgi:hypothetical protein
MDGCGAWEDAQCWVLELDAEGNPFGAARSMHQTPPNNGTFFLDIAAGGRDAVAISNEDYIRIEALLLALP